MNNRILKLAALSALLVLLNKPGFGQLSGTYTLPGMVNGTTVNNLTQLAALLNTSTVSGTVIFQFTGSYSDAAETYPINFTAFGGTGNVIIRPATSVTTPLITAGSPGITALINLSGVKDISFDGRPGGTGSRIQWAFQNTGNGSEYPTFQFINGASFDTLQYLAIQSSCTNTTPTILLSTSTASGGNSNNVIQHDSIGNYSSMPYLAIGSFGTAGANSNAGNSILNNNIYNFEGYYTSYNGAGVYIGSTGNGSNWNISNNSFYAAFTLNTGCVMPICFLPGSSSTGNTISGNHIGGQAPLCGGSPWKQWGDEGGVSWPPDFIGLYSDAGNVTISNNTIQNLAFGGGGADFYYSPSAICMYVVNGNASVNNNLIGSDSTANSVLNGWGGLLIGISNSSSGAVTINDNTVANLTQNYTLTAGSEIYSPIMGIYCYGSQAESSNNLGANTITNNKVYNISSIYGGEVENQYYPINSAYSSYNPDGIYNENPIAGIYLQTSGSATQIISRNIVYGLNINVSSGGSVSSIMGIVMNAGSGTNIVNANLVYGLWVPDTYGASNSYSGLVGIYLPTGNAGTYTITNNMIDLGLKSTDSSTVQNVYIFGIWDDNDENNSGTLNYDIYHNSIYIGGTYNNTYGNDLPSYGIARYFNWGSSVYENVKLYNNIIYNNRSGAAPNYGIYTESAAIDWASNYNLVYGTGNGFNFGNSGGTNYITQAAWYNATGMDDNTLTSNPLYDSPANLAPNLHVQSTSPVNEAGTPSFTIVYDFDSLIRADYTPVDIGAAVVGSCAPVIPMVSISPSTNNVCSGTSINFTTSETNGGTSPGYNFFVDGVSKQNGASNSYSSNTLNNGDSVWVVMISSAACASPDTVSSSKVYMVINPTVTPTVTISPSQNNVCAGTSINFSTTETNGGSSPTYNFFVDGTSKQNSSSNSYSPGSLNNGDSVWVVITSNAACASPTTATSAKAYMVINPTVTPTVTISPSQNNVCAGTSVNFTTTETNGGSSPTYDFFVDGISKQNGISSSYSGGSVNNGDSVWVVMTSDAACASSPTVTSAKVYMVINPTVTPTVTISPSQNNVCAGTSVNFTTTETNGGSSPTYDFYVDGVSKQNGISSSYSPGSLNNGDSVWVVITSNAACASPTTATSAKAYMVINPTVTPTVTISPSQNNVCAGTSINFSTTETNGGSSPTYNFYVDGISRQNTSSNSFSSISLNNGDSVWVVMTSNAACASPATATSTKVKMQITASVIPTITISPSQNNVCAGTSINFTTTETNGGSSPTYDFYVDGVSKQNSISSSYSPGSLNNGDSVWVVMISNAACASPGTVTSTKVYMQINPSVTPTVTLTPSALDSCAGATIDFTTGETNGGNAPTYNFYVNRVLAQNGTDNSYSSSTLQNGDSVWVVMISNAACAMPDTVISNHSILKIYPVAASSFSENICQGSSYFFKETNLTKAGSYPDTLQTIHGCDSIVTLILSVALPDTTNLSDTLCRGDSILFKGHLIGASGVYSDTLTSVASCDSFVILTVITPVTPVIEQAGNDTLYTTGNYATYQWLLNGQPVSGAKSARFIPNEDGNYSVAVTSLKDCADTSAPFPFQALGVNNITGNFDVHLYPNPGNGYFMLEFSDNAERLITVTDALGRCVIPEEKASMKQEITLNAAPGMYFLSIKQNGMRQVIKFINLSSM